MLFAFKCGQNLLQILAVLASKSQPQLLDSMLSLVLRSGFRSMAVISSFNGKLLDSFILLVCSFTLVCPLHLSKVKDLADEILGGEKTR